jgi:hypothetical protein
MWPSKDIDMNASAFLNSGSSNICWRAVREAQISTGYLGLNIVGFYLLKAKKVFVFLGERNGPPMECRVLSDVQPTDIAKRLSESVGFDLQWLLTIMAAAPNRTSSVERWPPRIESPSGRGVSDVVPCKHIPTNGKQDQVLAFVHIHPLRLRAKINKNAPKLER